MHELLSVFAEADVFPTTDCGDPHRNLDGIELATGALLLLVEEHPRGGSGPAVRL